MKLIFLLLIHVILSSGDVVQIRNFIDSPPTSIDVRCMDSHVDFGERVVRYGAEYEFNVVHQNFLIRWFGRTHFWCYIRKHGSKMVERIKVYGNGVPTDKVNVYHVMKYGVFNLQPTTVILPIAFEPRTYDFGIGRRD
jgi:hypothetical protein